MLVEETTGHWEHSEEGRKSSLTLWVSFSAQHSSKDSGILGQDIAQLVAACLPSMLEAGLALLHHIKPSMGLGTCCQA